MSTLHFKANWKNDPKRSTSLCTKWALRPSYACITDNQAEVTCKRCAKDLGITPAPKPVAKNLGTCPCCFRQQKTTKTVAMVHHGYQRPGIGYILGDCFGVRYPRFEDSCEGTIDFRVHLEEILRRRREYLERLQSGVVETLPFEYEVHVKDPVTGKTLKDGWRPVTKPTFVNVRKGDARIDRPYVYGGEPSIPGFDQLLADAIRKTETDIKSLTSHIAELQTAIDGWKKAE